MLAENDGGKIDPKAMKGKLGQFGAAGMLGRRASFVFRKATPSPASRSWELWLVVSIAGRRAPLPASAIASTLAQKHLIGAPSIRAVNLD